PSAIFFVDGMNESTAIKEATRLGIPTFGIVDSNTDPTPIDFPIPANDDSLKSIHFIVNHIADVIIEARGGVVDDGKGSIEKEIESYAAELNAAQSDDEVDSLDIDETDLASLNEPEDEPASEDKETN
ncbi:MAG: 30S ribosomal protein S2, partial [Fidelibacterota bacterium]